MRERFIVSAHSFIDVITNSSTELFVVESDKTVEVLERIVEKIWNKTAQWWSDLEIKSIDTINIDADDWYSFKPEDGKQYFEISVERNNTTKEFREEIEKTFTVVEYEMC